MSVEDVPGMYSLLLSYLQPCIIAAAVKFDIVDHLSEKAMTSQELATITNTQCSSLNRLLRALASIGILKEEDNDKYSVTKFGKLLDSKSKISLKNLAKYFLSDYYVAGGYLWHSIETPESAFHKSHGKSFFQLINDDSERSEIASKSYAEMDNVELKQILANYDFSVFERIVDVGGASGSLLKSLLRNYNKAFGVLFDQKNIIEKAEESLKNEFGERCKIVAGDFFDSVPSDGDCYILKMIIWNWDDEKAMKILRNIRKEMKSNTKLLIIESPFDKKSDVITDIFLMAMFGGKMRTIVEYKKLCSAAQLKIDRIISLPNCLHDIIELCAI